MDDVERQKEHFDNIASEYHSFMQNATHAYYFDKTWEILLRKVTLPTEKKVDFLEAMCGSADTITRFQRFNFTEISYNAFDYSPKMVAFAKEKHSNCRIWEQDVTTFCEPNAYDIIVIMAGLHHVNKHTERVLSNISASLKPGGLFFSCEPTHCNRIFGKVRDYLYKKSATFDCESEKDFSVSELNALASKNQLVAEYQIYPGLLAYVLVVIPLIFPRIGTGSKKTVGFFMRKLIDIESYFWGTFIARYFSFGTFTCFKKIIS